MWDLDGSGVVKRAIQNFQRELTSIYDIFDIVDTSERPKATNILITGERRNS